jgi:hypothetical protein
MRCAFSLVGTPLAALLVWLLPAGAGVAAPSDLPALGSITSHAAEVEPPTDKHLAPIPKATRTRASRQDKRPGAVPESGTLHSPELPPIGACLQPGSAGLENASGSPRTLFPRAPPSSV